MDQVPRFVCRRAAFALPVLSILAVACGESFRDRMLIAKSAEMDPTYPPYQSEMIKGIGSALATSMKTCFDQTPEPSRHSFSLVADIRPDGAAIRIAVQPRTNISACFADRIAELRFPPPPKYRDRDAFPIVLDMTISP